MPVPPKLANIPMLPHILSATHIITHIMQIASLYIKITNNLVALKSASENAAIYQGAGALNQEQFHNGSLDIAAFADTKDREQGAVATYQALQTQITTDIITLELLTHTPIITNTTTDITMDNTQEKSEKQIAKENRMWSESRKRPWSW